MSYVYRHIEVNRVIDGDSVVLTVDLGNKIKWTDSFRLFGIDTPERGQPGYQEATRRITEMLAHGLSRIETFKPDKYGRWLVDLYVNGEQGGELCVNAKLVAEGHAKPYFGGVKV